MSYPVRRTGLMVAGPMLFLCVLLAACSGSRTPSSDESPGTEHPPPPNPPERATPAPAPRTVQGFRIQILTTSDKPAADAQVESALAWWRGTPEARRLVALGSDEMAVEVKWKQPYYRVRLGNFATRDEARQALTLVKQHFPDAFVVPDTVTIWR